MAIGKNKKVIIVTGPTAVGKTAIAIELAKFFNTEIISADSRQCYKELNIGVARPSTRELQLAKHHFIASHSIQEEVSAITFEQYALQKAAELFKIHDVVIMVGGTGLYIKAFCEGMDLIPEIEASIRQKIIDSYESKGISWLQAQLKEKDPEYYDTGEMKNPQRMMRALEVIESTGNSIMFYRKGEKVERPFSIIKLGIEISKEELVAKINKRVDLMMEDGLLEEVISLVNYKKLNALQTVGYVELFDHLEEKITLDASVEKVKIATRQYAKRQLTWFKRDKDIKWFAPDQLNKIIEYIQ